VSAEICLFFEEGPNVEVLLETAFVVEIADNAVVL